MATVQQLARGQILRELIRAALDDAIVFIADPAHAAAVRAGMVKFTRATPEGLAFWIKVMREQGLIHGNPDPASMIAP